MKKIILYLSFALLFLSLTANAKPLYRYEDTLELSNSASLFKVREFYDDYNLSYSYIKVDLTDDNTKIDLLKSNDGIDVLTTVKGLAEQNENVITALNGDFFSNEGKGLGFSLGIEIRDGTLLQSPIYPDTMATVGIGQDEIVMSYMDFAITAHFGEENTVNIRHLNKHTTYYGDVLMYTSDWNGGMTKGVGGNVAEYVFEDNVLVEIRRNLEPINISENGFVLVVDEGMNGSLAGLNVGDSVEIKTTCSLDLDSFETSFGSGSMLVFEGKDVGKIGDYAHTVAGFHPRSAAGVTEDGNTLYLVAVDGRQEASRGMRMSHLAELLIDLGCYYGVNLDGGGSTSLVAKDMWNDTFNVINNPTETRKVINAVGVIHETDEHSGIPAGISLKSHSQNVFIDDCVGIDVILYDKYKRKAEFDEDKLEWQLESGRIENGLFYPEKQGSVIIGAVYEDLYSDITLNVIKDISGINTSKKRHMQVGDEQDIIISVFDDLGNNVKVNDTAGFVFESSNENVATVIDGRIVAKKDGNAIITVSYGNIKTYISVSVGSTSKPYSDSFETNDRISDVYPDDTKGGFAVSKDYSRIGDFSGKFNFDFTQLEDAHVNEQQDTEHEIISIDETQEEDIARAVYYTLSSNVPIDENDDEILIYVYTEKPFNHKVRAMLIDGNGNDKAIDFEGEIKEGEWCRLSARVPARLKKPASLSRIYVLYSPGEEKDEGTIYIDDLQFTTFEINIPKVSPNDTYRMGHINTNVKNHFRVATLCDKETILPTAVYGDQSVKLYASKVGNSILLGEGAKMSVSEDLNSYYIHLDTSKGGIRSTDKSQWQTIAKIAEDSDKKYLFITCDSSVFGDDEFENEVIVDFFNSLDKQVFIVQTDSFASYTDYGNLKLFTLDNSPSSSLVTNRQRSANVIDFYFGDIVTFEFKNI